MRRQLCSERTANLGVPFYGRSRKVDPSCGDRGCAVLGKGQGSTCLPSSLGTDIIPFYELEYYLVRMRFLPIVWYGKLRSCPRTRRVIRLTHPQPRWPGPTHIFTLECCCSPMVCSLPTFIFVNIPTYILVHQARISVTILS